jgi:hypothetical protein
VRETNATVAANGAVVNRGHRAPAAGPHVLEQPAEAPRGDQDGGNGRIVETSTDEAQVARRFLDRSGSPPGAGALFGLAVVPRDGGVYYVGDASNTFRLLH